jgi:hypothetical protein
MPNPQNPMRSGNFKSNISQASNTFRAAALFYMEAGAANLPLPDWTHEGGRRGLHRNRDCDRADGEAPGEETIFHGKCELSAEVRVSRRNCLCILHLSFYICHLSLKKLHIFNDKLQM